MNDAERGITVLHRIHDDAHREEIVNLVHGLVLVHHLPVYAEEMFDASLNLRLYVRLFHIFGDFPDYLRDELLPLCLSLVYLTDKIVKDVGHVIFKRQIVQLRLYSRYAEPLGDGRVNIHRLLGFLPLLLRSHKLESSHIVQAVGELNKDDPYILRHGEEHLSQILRLKLKLIGGIRKSAQLCDAVDQ